MKRALKSRTAIGNQANAWAAIHQPRHIAFLRQFVEWADACHITLYELTSDHLVQFIVVSDKARMAAGKLTYSWSMMRQIESLIMRVFPSTVDARRRLAASRKVV